MNTLLLTPTQLTKIRFNEYKNKAKEEGISLKVFRDHAIANHPQYNTPEGWERIRNCWNGRAADLILTELLQELTTNN